MYPYIKVIQNIKIGRYFGHDYGFKFHPKNDYRETLSNEGGH